MTAEDVARFDSGSFPPARFHHREHVAMAYALLREAPFHEVVARYAKGVRRIAEQVDKADLFNETITIASLALIAEAMRGSDAGDFDTFASANPELFERGLFERYYSAERLKSASARTAFVLPDRIQV